MQADSAFNEDSVDLLCAGGFTHAQEWIRYVKRCCRNSSYDQSVFEGTSLWRSSTKGRRVSMAKYRLARRWFFRERENREPISMPNYVMVEPGARVKICLNGRIRKVSIRLMKQAHL